MAKLIYEISFLGGLAIKSAFAGLSALSSQLSAFGYQLSFQLSAFGLPAIRSSASGPKQRIIRVKKVVGKVLRIPSFMINITS